MVEKTVSLTGDCKSDFEEGLKILSGVHSYMLVGETQDAELQIRLQHIEEEKLKIERKKEKCTIYYNQKAHFFRGVSLLLQNKNKPQFNLEEESNFESNGIMMDCSRNCVPSVETIKNYIVKLAEFGMNRLYLYMEDTLEIEGYPYWGYLRGRFKKEEMQECDQFARLFGITIVPCIQTLAHLRSVLKQPMFEEYKDIDDILLLENEKTEDLLRALLETVSQCFSGGIVHLGMDEAAHLGRGKYLEKKGYCNPAGVMKKHLEWLCKTCERIGLKPIIWSDMYLKLNFGVEDYYSLSEDAQPKNIENLSDKISLCYWDYYNEGEKFYEKYIRLHQKLGNPVVFAGGAWTWNGIAPGVSKALKTTHDALQACYKTGVKDVFCTVWMDNGAETPLATMLPIFALYGEYGFSKDLSEENIRNRFRFCFGKEWESYCLLDAFDNPVYEDGQHNQYCENPSKTILYEDNLMGLYIKMFDEEKLKIRYEKLAEKLNIILKEQNNMDEEDRRIFGYYSILAELLAKKSGITARIKDAYCAKDMGKIKGIIKNELNEIEQLAEKLRIKRQSIWMEEYKPFGYEILDIRLAGVSVRARSAADRLACFMNGKISCIPEVEEEILPYKTEEMLEKELLHGYYMWDRLISAGNIDGV